MELDLDVARARLTLRDEHQATRWEVVLDANVLGRACFREGLIWQDAGLACIGAAELVQFASAKRGPRKFFELGTGDRRGELRLHTLRPSAWSLFGHLGDFTLANSSLLLVLTYTDAIAVDAHLGVRWVARDLAVDGLLVNHASGENIALSAEMAPPGGWFKVVIDASTGRELSREAALSEGYVGPTAGKP